MCTQLHTTRILIIVVHQIVRSTKLEAVACLYHVKIVPVDLIVFPTIVVVREAIIDSSKAWRNIIHNMSLSFWRVYFLDQNLVSFCPFRVGVRVRVRFRFSYDCYIVNFWLLDTLHFLTNTFHTVGPICNFCGAIRIVICELQNKSEALHFCFK